MNGQWYVWKARPYLYIQEYKRFFDVLDQNLKYPQSLFRVWNPNTQQSYPSYGLPDSTFPPRNSIDFRLLDTNQNGKIDPKDDAYSPFYPGNQFVDIISTSVYNFGTYLNGNGYNVVPPPQTVNNFLDSIYNFSVSHSKPFGILETGSLWIHNNTRSPSTTDSEFDVKSAWIQQIFNFIQLNNNTKFAIFLQEQKVEDQLQQTCNLKKCPLSQQTVDWEFFTVPQLTSFYHQLIQKFNFSTNSSSIFRIY